MLHDKMTKEELLTLALFDNGGIDDTDLYRDTTDSTYESVKTLSNCGAFPMLSLTAEINAVQDLHGYDKPWAGGAGKNLIPMTVADVKSANTSGTWSGNSYVYGGITYTIQTDSGGNVIGINADGTSTSAYAPFYLSSQMNVESGKEYIINGSPQSPSSSTWRLWVESSTAFPSGNRLSDDAVGDSRRTAMANETVSVYIQIFAGQILSNKMFYPMIRLASVADATFAPYSNICPISGWDDVEVTIADDVETPTVENVYTIDLDGTRYGGSVDVVNGVMTVDRGYIASYNGETLPSTWISDRDVYAEGTTPTIGAEVVYELATPLTIQLTPTQVKLLLGINNLWANSGDVGDARYFKKVEL